MSAIPTRIIRPLPWEFDDGGRAEAGFASSTDAGDCVCRAIAIATGRRYADVYAELAALSGEMGYRRSARSGVANRVMKKYLSQFPWTPTMHIGSGCTTHLAYGELPSGHLIARLTKHLCAVVDGVVRDDHDPSRDGTRCVYGYWTVSS